MFYVYNPKANTKKGEGETTEDILLDSHNSWTRVKGYALAEEVAPYIRDYGKQYIHSIKFAPPTVLNSLNMPSLRIGLAFITNKSDSEKLWNLEWQENVAKAIAAGIIDFRNEIEEGVRN